MKERPILFSTEMVRAILEGRKTMTRRIMQKQPTMKHKFKYICKEKTKGWGALFEWLTDGMTLHEHFKSPYGTIGDVLWVRETWAEFQGLEDAPTCYVYKADGTWDDKVHLIDNKWKPSIFMPRSASRISLRITNIRVERLNDITEEDAVREGVEPLENGYKQYIRTRLDKVTEYASYSFMTLWESINGKGSWEKNPWVWVIEFEAIK